MTTKSLATAVRQAVLCLGLAASLASFAAPARADDLPKFKDPDVNAFIKKFDDLVNIEVAAIKAKDDAKATATDAKIDELMKQGDALDSKFAPDEQDLLVKFMTAEGRKVAEAKQATK